MANTTIQLKHSTLTGNVPSSLANGEISINNRDGKFFYSTPAGVVVTHYPYLGPSGLNQEVQFNDSGVLGSDSGLTYNKTTDVLTVVGGAIIGGVNVIPQIQLAFTQANSNYTSAVTKLDVTNSGASAYLIDQYSGNNPSIYVSGGETIAFNLNVSGHPFVIRESSGGANTSTGLTHVSTTGVVSTGASAQGYVTGVLYWKVPFDLVGSTYVYQCTIHGGMVGNIVIQQPASFVAANTTLAFNQANAAFNQANNENGVNNTQNTNITAAFTAANTAQNTATSAGVYANGAFIQANTPSHVANSAASYANSAFSTANSASAVSASSYANSAFVTANSAGVYANSAFLTANTPSHVANSAASYANSAFSTANSASAVSASSYANSAFNKANTANVTADAGFEKANAAFIHANSAFDAANTGGGGAANSFGQIVANVGTILATSSNDSLQIVGESGISVSSNVSAKKVIVSVPAGFTFTTADYGFVTDSTNVIYDYGTL